MTIEEARLFFKFNEDEHLQDAYDDQLFEFKQFFLSKPIILKVFKSKIEKLKKFENAYCLLSNSRFKPFTFEDYSIEFSDRVLEAFQLYEQKKSELKQQIMSVNNSNAVAQNVQKLLDVTYLYYQKWQTSEVIEIELDVIAKDPDAMELLSSIRAFEANGGENFSDILVQKNQPILMKEMKRVSLQSLKTTRGGILRYDHY